MYFGAHDSSTPKTSKIDPNMAGAAIRSALQNKENYEPKKLNYPGVANWSTPNDEAQRNSSTSNHTYRSSLHTTVSPPNKLKF